MKMIDIDYDKNGLAIETFVGTIAAGPFASKVVESMFNFDAARYDKILVGSVPYKLDTGEFVYQKYWTNSGNKFSSVTFCAGDQIILKRYNEGRLIIR